MAANPTMLLISTPADFSLKLFFEQDSSKLIKPSSLFYDSSPEEIKKTISQDFDFIYFRDPFNDQGVSQQLTKGTTKLVLARYPNTRKVDCISSYEDMLFEDKWKQYELLSQFMPHTEQMKSKNTFKLDNKIIKKRLSARSKGIILRREDFPANAEPSEYIVQSKLDIEIEYRVYVVGGVIVEPMAVKSSKTTSQRVKITGIEDKIDPQIKEICKAAYQATKYDLIGLDIAKTKNGFVLLEVNRSPQFKGFFRLSGQNLAVILSSYLLGSSNP